MVYNILVVDFSSQLNYTTKNGCCLIFFEIAAYFFTAPFYFLNITRKAVICYTLCIFTQIFNKLTIYYP